MKRELVTVQDHIDAGWKIISDGPSGIQLEGPPVMPNSDKVVLAFGILTFWYYGVGLFFIAIALIDTHALTKRPSKFISR